MPFHRMPGIGDVPTLASVTMDDMVNVAHERASRTRKDIAQARKDIWDEDHVQQVRQRLRTWYSNRVIQNLVCKHAIPFPNPGKDITREVACVYKNGAFRLLTGESEDTQRAWNQLLAEDSIDTQAAFLNRMALLMATSHAIPVARGPAGSRRLQREIKLANVIDVVTDPADPMGWPKAAIWEVHDGTHIDQTNKKRVVWVVVNQHEWIYLNVDGKQVNGPDGVPRATHGATDENGKPACPVVPYSVHDRTDDYWGLDQNARLHEGTIYVGALNARLSAVRSTQDHKQLVLTAANKEAIPSKQLMGGDPQGPLEIYALGAGAPAKAESLDTIVDPSDHIRHMQWVTTQMARAYGISDDAVVVSDSAGTTPVMSISLRNEERQAIRNEQIGPARNFERRLAVITSSVAKHAGHKLASKIPGPSEIFESFELDLPDLNTIDDPKKRMEMDDWQRERGLISIVDIGRRDKWPTRTRAEILKMIKRNVAEDNVVRTDLAERQQSMKPDTNAPGATPEQIQGRKTGADGPAVRDGTPPPDGDG